jgi:hypothetical protein
MILSWPPKTETHQTKTVYITCKGTALKQNAETHMHVWQKRTQLKMQNSKTADPKRKN